jgi:hypothetical protein
MNPQRLKCGALVLAAAGLPGCAGVHIGLGLPVGGPGSVGLSMGSDGRVSGGVAVGRGGVSVGVGGSAPLPKPLDPAPTAASAPQP